MPDTNTVTIPLDEYFDLRSKAEANSFLMAELGRLDGRLAEFDHRLWEFQRKLEEKDHGK